MEPEQEEELLARWEERRWQEHVDTIGPRVYRNGSDVRPDVYRIQCTETDLLCIETGIKLYLKSLEQDLVRALAGINTQRNDDETYPEDAAFLAQMIARQCRLLANAQWMRTHPDSMESGL